MSSAWEPEGRLHDGIRLCHRRLFRVAILAMARTEDMRERMGRIAVAYDKRGNPLPPKTCVAGYDRVDGGCN